MARFSLIRLLQSLVLVILALAVLFAGYRFVRADLAAHVYRQRLSVLAQDYESLRGNYNEAVRRTAVTELIVKDKKLSVRVVNDRGVVREVSTPFDPSKEIFVDFAVVNQRLWIRRVFDASTPAERAVVIDPDMATIDWNGPDASHGKAVYRTLGEGRWIIKVSGDGALSLGRAEGDEKPKLAAAPAIKDYRQAEAEAKTQAEAIGPMDVWRWLTGD